MTISNELTQTKRLFLLLEGTWTGEGRGEFPGVTSFAYRETLLITRRDENSLNYEQRTQKLYDGQTEYLPSHSENGLIRLLENGDLELRSKQTGRSEVLTGSIEPVRDGFCIHFVSRTISDDPRMISSARLLELEGDTLRYEMAMHTTKVGRLTPHLEIILNRVK